MQKETVGSSKRHHICIHLAEMPTDPIFRKLIRGELPTTTDELEDIFDYGDLEPLEDDDTDDDEEDELDDWDFGDDWSEDESEDDES